MVTTRKSQEVYGVVPASKIIGEEVVTRDDEKLGKIRELVIDAHEGHLAYAVLAFGDKQIAIPWNAFEFANTEHKLILDVDPAKLHDAPGFDKNDGWPNFVDSTWTDKGQKHYGAQPYSSEAGTTTMRPLEY